MSKNIPRSIASAFGSARRFRAFHRTSLKRVQKELSKAMRASAYSPGYFDLKQAQESLAKAIEAARPANWEGRK